MLEVGWTHIRILPGIEISSYQSQYSKAKQKNLQQMMEMA